MKHTNVVITKAPFNRGNNAEALRMGVGLTLAENAVQVLFMGDGVYTLLPLAPHLVGAEIIDKHLEALRHLNCALLAEEEALDARGLLSLPHGVERRPQRELYRLLAEGEVNICY